jgi:hypothetical protein
MMAHINLTWWKALEIPLSESDWRNVKLYCALDTNWESDKEYVYVIRLSPPFAIHYERADTPIIYIGRAHNASSVKQRWNSHIANWIKPLGRWLPGGRYDMWVLEDHRYKEIESDFLTLFKQEFGRLPLANFQGGVPDGIVRHTYDEGELGGLADATSDRRYWWALTPLQADVKAYFDKGVAE